MLKQRAISGAVILVVAVVAVAVTGGFLLKGRALRPEPPATPLKVAAATKAVARPRETVQSAPIPPLNRADLIAAAQEAGAIYGAGAMTGAANRDLVGRRFLVRLPFGCLGPSTAPGAEPARWEFDTARRTAKLSAEPQAWTETNWISKITGPKQFDSIEGFWIARPWLVSDACPKRQDQSPDAPPPSPAAPPAPPSQSVGLATFVPNRDARASRRALRSYQAAFRPRPNDVAAFGTQGFQLVLTGRVGSYADDSAIHCYSPSLDDRPVCLINVEIDSVAFIDVAMETSLAEWRNR